MKKIIETIKLTGEIIEFAPKNEAELVEAYRLCSETIKAYEAAKKKLAVYAEAYIGPYGTSELIDGYIFRSSSIQRMNYDKAILRQVIQDEDALDQLLIVDKKGVDDYRKTHLEELGEDSRLLADTMIPIGKPYSVIRLEKI